MISLFAYKNIRSFWLLALWAIILESKIFFHFHLTNISVADVYCSLVLCCNWVSTEVIQSFKISSFHKFSFSSPVKLVLSSFEVDKNTKKKTRMDWNNANQRQAFFWINALSIASILWPVNLKRLQKHSKKARGILEVSALLIGVSLTFTEHVNMSIRIQTARPNIKLVIFFYCESIDSVLVTKFHLMWNQYKIH